MNPKRPAIRPEKQPLDTSDDAALDDSLSRLQGNRSVHDRLTTLRRLAEYWHGAFQPEDGLAEHEFHGWRLPMPLRWWFQVAGRRSSVLSHQNHLLRPDRSGWESLQLVEGGKLLFYTENQGVYLWSTAPEGDDPPVWGRFNENGVPWTEEGMTLSEFLVGICLFEAIMQAPFGAAAAWAEQQALDKIVAKLPPLPLVPWRWPSFPSRFFGSSGAFMFACPNDDNRGNAAFSIWVGAK
jgi:hypothetical protein